MDRLGDNIRVRKGARNLPGLKNEVEDLKSKLIESNERGGIDPVTGLHNRRFFNESLYDHLVQMSRDSERQPGNGLALVTIDLDNFKSVNDKFGHAAGDKALNAVAKSLIANLREVDIKARPGGDEFAILMPTTDIEDLRRKFFGDTDQPHKGNEPGSILFKINQSIHEEIKNIQRENPSFNWEPAYFDDVPTYFSAGMDFLATNLVRGVSGEGLTHGMEYLINSSDAAEILAKGLRKTNRKNLY